VGTVRRMNRRHPESPATPHLFRDPTPGKKALSVFGQTVSGSEGTAAPGLRVRLGYFQRGAACCSRFSHDVNPGARRTLLRTVPRGGPPSPLVFQNHRFSARPSVKSLSSKNLHAKSRAQCT
jgi:hypothetical protein